MKKISLFLLAANLIVSLWLYTNFNQSQTTVAKEEPRANNAEVILTLGEVGVEPVQNLIELETNDDTLSILFNAGRGLQKSVQNFQESVETRVNEMMGFVGAAIDNIEIPVAPTSQCYTLGPFLLAQNADSAAERLQEKNIQLVASETERPGLIGYQVTIPSDSLRSARKQIDELERRGVEDVGFSSESGVINSVSLGFYSSEERAWRRQTEISNIGFYTRIDKRVIRTPEYWIDITLTSEQDLGMINAVGSIDWPSLKQTFCREAGNS